jgi:hypothetical protein
VQEHVGDIAAKVEPETLEPTGEPQPNPSDYDDGVADVELGPPVVGQFVRITGGDYAGRNAVYLGDVAAPASDDPEDKKKPPAEPPEMIQVRTRDADNLVLDVAYADVASTTYSGGR